MTRAALLSSTTDYCLLRKFTGHPCAPEHTSLKPSGRTSQFPRRCKPQERRLPVNDSGQPFGGSMPTQTRGVLRTTFSLFASLLLAAACAQAQEGASTAAAARTRYLSEMGLIPASRSAAVEEFVNYHRHQ